MRKITALLLAAVTVAGCLSLRQTGTGQETGTPPVIERVVMFGVDGAGDFWKDATTPRLDEIFAAGAVTHTMQAMLPRSRRRISARCCWVSVPKCTGSTTT